MVVASAWVRPEIPRGQEVLKKVAFELVGNGVPSLLHKRGFEARCRCILGYCKAWEVDQSTDSGYGISLGQTITPLIGKMESPRGVDTTINPSPVLVPKQSSQVQPEIIDSPEIVVSPDNPIYKFDSKAKNKYVSIALPHHMKKGNRQMAE